jgi:methyltransferase (TIGR00027 family)
VRTDDDSWDITESVGATALGVAAARAADTESDDPLISDPFARIFLDTAGPGEWDWYGAPELPAEVVEAVPALPLRMKSMVSFFATRTKFFDTFFLDAANAGIEQIVMLAAGLDARCWRLPWPDGVTVFELDQPRVLDFKASTLHQHGAEPTCNRIAVPVDLRQDWPTALQDNGFDASKPSAWSAEGLLMYLPAAAQELLFERVEGLTAAGSRVGIEALSPNFADPAAAAQRRERLEWVRAIMATADPHRAVPRTDELWYFDEREDVGDWWRRHGWQVTVRPSDELMTSYGRTPPQEIDDGTPPYLFVSAQRGGA